MPNASNAVLESSSTAGQIFQSGGNSSAPFYSTATYPVTAGTVKNQLQSNGTNWISTPTFQITTFSLTNAQVRALQTTPAITLISAQGSGVVIIPFGYILKFVYGGTNPYTNGPTTYLQYGTSVSTSTAYNLGALTAFWEATANYYSIGNLTLPKLYSLSIVENKPLSIGISTALTGNAAHDNTVTGSIAWYPLTI